MCIRDSKPIAVDVSKPSMIGAPMVRLDKEGRDKRKKKVNLIQEVLNNYIKKASDDYKDGKINSVELQIIMGSLLSNQGSILALAAQYKYDEVGMDELLEELGAKDFN